MAGNRSERINEELKRELSEIIRELKDPRIPELVSVVKVSATKDLKYAKVYVSIFTTGEKKKEDAIAGLSSCAGFVRREVAARLNLRQTPEILFVPDDSIEYGAHINQVLKDIDKS